MSTPLVPPLLAAASNAALYTFLLYTMAVFVLAWLSSRLLAAQAFQESRFDARARSWAGARGLMQVMPATGRQFGIEDLYEPERNVEAAARFVEYLEGFWAERIADPDERLRFLLASYNVGPGHVEDARRLAEKHGDDPDRWTDVRYWLLQKSKRRYYTDPVVRHGFARGLEPVTYVDRILRRFAHYRDLVPERPATRTAAR